MEMDDWLIQIDKTSQDIIEITKKIDDFVGNIIIKIPVELDQYTLLRQLISVAKSFDLYEHVDLIIKTCWRLDTQVNGSSPQLFGIIFDEIGTHPEITHIELLYIKRFAKWTYYNSKCEPMHEREGQIDHFEEWWFEFFPNHFDPYVETIRRHVAAENRRQASLRLKQNIQQQRLARTKK